MRWAWRLTGTGWRSCRYAVTFVVLAGCSKSSGEERSNPVLSDSAGVQVLSPAPNEIAGGIADALTLEPAFEIGGARTEIGYVGDVDFNDDGSLWVLDRMNARVLRYDSDGNRVAAFGRRGEGPGELSDPIAIAASGRTLIVMDRGGVFSALDSTGMLIARRSDVDSDWLAIGLREPDDRFEPGYVNPPEDVTRRIAGTRDGGFILQVQIDETRAMALGVDVLHMERSAWLVRYDRTMTVADTLAVLSLPPLRIAHEHEDAYPLVSEGHFAVRPHWTVGEEWIATVDRDSAVVHIEPLSGSFESTTIRWKPARLPLDDVDRQAYWTWWLRRQTQHGSEEVRAWLGSQSDGERESTIDRAASEMVVPAHRPEVMAVYGAGQCLWIAGFNSLDHHSGTSLKLLALGVRSGQIEWHVRIPRIGSRLRAFAPRAIATSYVDRDGVVRVEVYHLPDARCEA